MYTKTLDGIISLLSTPTQRESLVKGEKSIQYIAENITTKCIYHQEPCICMHCLLLGRLSTRSLIS